MTDAADRAQELIEQHRDTALRTHLHLRRAGRAQQTLHCHRCGEEIPQERRDAVPDCCLCVECQDDFEKGMR